MTRAALPHKLGPPISNRDPPAVATGGGAPCPPRRPIACLAAAADPHHGRMAKARAGKPKPSLTLGQATTISAPVAGTWSRLARTSI